MEFRLQAERYCADFREFRLKAELHARNSMQELHAGTPCRKGAELTKGKEENLSSLTRLLLKTPESRMNYLRTGTLRTCPARSLDVEPSRLSVVMSRTDVL